MTGAVIYSADSHIVEPADLWTKYIDRKFLDKAPRAYEKDGAVRFVIDGNIQLGSVGGPSQAGVRFDDPSKVTFEGTWEDVRPGAFDPLPRLKDLERDGVKGEVIYATLGSRLYSVVHDSDLLTACLNAVNAFLIETFTQTYPDVFKTVALLNVDDVDKAVHELQRCVKAGMSVGMIPTYPGEDNPYHLERYDRLWAAAQDLDVPLAFHIASCRPGPGQLSVFTHEAGKPGAAAYVSTMDYWMRRSLASMIFVGVFERYPRLKVAVVEHELSWALYFLKMMDMYYTELGQVSPYRFKGSLVPSDFFRTNIFLTFMEDKVGVESLLPIIGADTLMFGSDYPHSESTWPRSTEYLHRMLATASSEVRRKLTADNAASLFKFT